MYHLSILWFCTCKKRSASVSVIYGEKTGDLGTVDEPFKPPWDHRAGLVSTSGVSSASDLLIPSFDGSSLIASGRY